VVALLDPAEITFREQDNTPAHPDVGEAYAGLVARSGLTTVSYRELFDGGPTERSGLLEQRFGLLRPQDIGLDLG
jgi:hypothetical protein